MQLCRFFDPQHGERLGAVRDGNVYDITQHWPSLTAWLHDTIGRADINQPLEAAIADAQPVVSFGELNTPAKEGQIALLKPTDDQEVWAAGVTYERSRIAREEESAGSGIYDRVYTAPRPEIFFKATPGRTVGPYQPVAIRADSRWNVPEPELGLVLNPALELVGFTIGNDMSSRDIEGENPLYLPQAKMYARCCALGPAITLRSAIPNPNDLTISIRIVRDGSAIFSGEVSTRRIVRTFAELIDYLGRDNIFSHGAVLLTGTGIVPPDDISLHAGDEVVITIDGIGTLHNPIMSGGK
jgi:2-dehydro-3-deoxy-D-arabinonate dehydratase